MRQGVGQQETLLAVRRDISGANLADLNQHVRDEGSHIALGNKENCFTAFETVNGSLSKSRHIKSPKYPRERFMAFRITVLLINVLGERSIGSRSVLAP